MCILTPEYNESDNTYHIIQEQYIQHQLQVPINGTQYRILSFKKWRNIYIMLSKFIDFKIFIIPV